MKNISIPKVKSMAKMFPRNDCFSCNISLQNIYAPSVETIERMFEYIYYVNVNFKNINFSSLKLVRYTFYSSQFYNLNMENVDAPNIESLDYMFDSYLYNASFKNINFSNAISMKNFLPYDKYNISFINVNISKIKTLEEIFIGNNAHLYYLKLENVDISSVTSMKNMIDINGLGSNKKEIIIKNINASNLLDLDHIIRYGSNSNITFENINFPKITLIENMFGYGSYTNGRISLININAPEVKTIKNLFADEYILSELIIIKDINIPKCLTMENIFKSLTVKTIILENINAQSLQTMKSIFLDVPSLQSVHLTNLNAPNLIEIEKLLCNCYSNPNLELTFENVNISNISTMKEMFMECYRLSKIEYINFDASNLLSMEKMFYNCQNLKNVTFINFNAPKLSNTSKMFYYCVNLIDIKLDGILTNINVSKLISIEEMFSYCVKLNTFNLENITFTELTNMERTFSYCEKIENIIFKNLEFKKTVSMTDMFMSNPQLNYVCFKNINMAKTLILKKIFKYSNLKTVKFENIDVSGATAIENICNDNFINEIYFKNINISSLESFGELFGKCSKLLNLYFEDIYAPNIIKIENIFNLTNSIENFSFINIDISKTTSMKELFINCGNCKNIIFKNISSNSLNDISKMFYNLPKMDILDISGLNTSKVKTLERMFENYKGHFLNLSNLDFSSAINMNKMFSNSIELISLDLSNFTVLNIEEMDYMFSNCSNLEVLNLSSFYTPKIISAKNAFQNCYSLKYINLGRFDGSLIKGLFSSCYNLEFIDISNILMDKIEYMNEMFYDFHFLKRLDLPKFNTEKVKNFSEMFYNCYNLETINFNSFNTSSAYGDAFKKMFYNCSQLKSIDLSRFETCLITSMNQMFYNCSNLEELNLETFNTSSVIDLQEMFSGCTKLKKLDISNFDTSNVINMEGIFSNCENLNYINFENIKTNSLLEMSEMFKGNINLNYLNLISLEILHSINILNILSEVNNNIIYCINDESKAITIKQEFDKKENATNNCTLICQKEEKQYLSEAGICSITCINEDINKYIYEDKCVLGCPLNSPYELVIYNLCTKKCFSGDFFVKKCKINNKNQEIYDQLINQILDEIIKNKLNQLIFPSIYEKNEELLIQEEDIIIEIISNNIKNNFNNISSIFLGECEQKLKNYYSIDSNNSLLILKIDIIIPEFFIPIVEYKVFNPETNQPLDLDICNENPITLLYPVLKDIENNTIFFHDPNNEYYKDKCIPVTNENSTDLILNDRKNEYNNNFLGLCEKDCEFIEYNIEAKSSKCNCKAKINFRNSKDIVIDKKRLLNNFMDLKSTMNIDIIFCVKALFSRNGLIYNMGNYIMLLNIIISFIYLILFYSKEYKNIFLKIREIIKSKKKEKKKMFNYQDIQTINDYENANNKNEKIFSEKSNKLNLKKNNFPPKRNINLENIDKISANISLKETKVYSKLKFNLTQNNIGSNTDKNINISHLNKIFGIENKDVRNEIKMHKNYTDNEINTLKYKDALIIDNRTFFQYYLSLLKTKHILIFSFYTSNDYNPRTIKIVLFLFTFSLLFFVTSLFFQDSTMHKIYEDNGIFDIIYQIPKIIYSTIITSAITLVVKDLSLIEKSIIKIKKDENAVENSDKIKKLLKSIKIRFIIFNILIFLFYFIFWYYLSCFCAVYKNTQIHLLKDVLLSFTLSLFYPFALNLLPGILRIPALKKESKRRDCLYSISKIIQII